MFFFISAVSSFIFGITGLIMMTKSEAVNMDFDLFTYTLPFVAFMYDHSLKKVKLYGERSIFIIAKLLIIIYYLGFFVLSLQATSTSKFYIIANVNFIVYPVFAVGYSYLLSLNKFK